MTTYNGSRFVIEQLESIRIQSRPVDEVIIHDDRSTDGTVQLVQEYIKNYNLKNWRIEVNAVNIGFSNNFWNTILDCNGDIIFLADQDDVWYQNKVEAMALFMESHSEFGCIASAYEVCDSEGRLIDKKIRNQWTKDDGSYESIGLEYFIYGKRAIGASMCFRKNLIDNEEPLDIGDFGHDSLISFYATIKSQMAFYGKRLFKYRIHDNNTSSVALKKEHQFSTDRILKYCKWLEDQGLIIDELSKQPFLSEIHRKQMIDQASFMFTRSALIREFSTKLMLKLISYIHEYRMTSRKGLMGGCYMLFMDIRFSLYSKHRKISYGEQS